MKPILFNTEMVRAILDGRKTQTRRIFKDGTEYTEPDMSFFDKQRRTIAIHNYADITHEQRYSTCEIPCPICIGDILYVRETWCDPSGTGYPIMYKADMPIHYDAKDTETGISDINITENDFKWSPSIHMPREAARLFLRVTNVSVERLHDIKCGTIKAEGLNTIRSCPKCNHGEHFSACAKMMKSLWNSTVNKKDLDKYGWEANPWVWVYEFERITKEKAYN